MARNKDQHDHGDDQDATAEHDTLDEAGDDARIDDNHGVPGGSELRDEHSVPTNAAGDAAERERLQTARAAGTDDRDPIDGAQEP